MRISRVVRAILILGVAAFVLLDNGRSLGLPVYWINIEHGPAARINCLANGSYLPAPEARSTGLGWPLRYFDSNGRPLLCNFHTNRLNPVALVADLALVSLIALLIARPRLFNLAKS